MPITNLELIGYKTFASTTTFDFAEQITAIVGPNGSGKSNIADAIRWVLGEQSYSLLRGRKTVDMIFSGSEARARAGMASATLVFDNTSGWLPIDFSEVAVTRRAYRDGNNEYLINGQKVRLRDVSELLSRAGLAERTYTIIGQGLVDAALSLKAGERRKLFEEAAGIGIYRSRREEALRKLEATRRNLERVGDILSELSPRLRSLERQARRAGEHENLTKDLHVLLREWYGFHWHVRQNKLREAQVNTRSRENTLHDARRRQGKLDEEVAGFRKQIHDLRERLNAWHDESGLLHSRRERVSRDLAVAMERISGLHDKKDQAATEKVRTIEEHRLLQDRLDRTRRDLERLEKELEEAQAQRIAARETLDSARVFRRELAGQQDHLLQEKEVQAARITQNETRIEELKQLSDASRIERLNLEENLSSMENQAAGTGERVGELEQQTKDLEAGAAEYGRQLQEKIGEIATLEQESLSIQKKIGALAADRSRLEAQFEVLQQADQAMAGFSRGSQALARSFKGNPNPFAGKALGSLIEVESPYERAVAAALGPHLDSIILFDRETLFPALLMLEKHELSAGLLPLDSANGKGRTVVDHPAVMARVVDQVGAPAEVLPVVEALLADAVIVEDKQAAVELRGHFSGRIITLKGEVFEPTGAVVATGKSGAGLIARPRKLREISLRLKELVMDLGVLETERGSLDGHIDTMRVEFEALEGVHNHLQSELESARTDRMNKHTELEQQRARISWLKNRHEDLTREVEGIERKIEIARSEVEDSGIELDGINTRLAELHQQFDDRPLEELQAQVAYWNTQVAVTDRAVSDARLRMEERQQAFEQAGHRLETLQNAIETGDTQSGDLREEIQRLEQEEQAIGEQLDRLMGLITPAEENLDELESRQDNIREAELETRQALSTAERNHAQAQILLARRQEALDSLRQRIEDDFGIVAFEFMDDVPGQAPLPLEELVETLPMVREISPDLELSIKRQRAQLRRMGAINPEAQEEYKEVEARHSFMVGQIEDLNRAEQDVLEVINELDLIMEREFRKTFDEVAREFRTTFTRLFGGGAARIVLTDPDDLTISGVDIEARLPGRRAQGLSLLSGGERSLTAIALVFSLIKVSPTPFCVLDEVDAMLDEANVNRFADLLRELSQNTQFIIITHNRNTVQSAETIYGITMGRDSTSQVLGLKLDEVATVV